VTNQENTIIKLQEQQQETIQKKFSIDAKLATIEERKQGIKKLGKEFDIGKVRSEHNKVENDLNKAFIEESSCLTQLKDLQQQMRVKEGELFKVQAREANVKESVAYDRAIEAILALNKEAKFKNKIYGTVSQLGQVEERYAKALEVAAGSRMKSIVVDNDETASKCIAILKEKRSGIATFLPLNKIRGRAKSHLSGKGIHGSALDLVTFDKKFKDVFSHVFSSTLVVDDVQTARRIGIGKARMVTLDGDIMEISGAMIGGHRIHQRISFQDKKSSGTTKNLQEEVKNLEKKRNIIYKRKEELEQKTTKLRQKKNELEGSIVRIEKSFEGSNLNELEEEEKNLKNHEVYKQHNELEQQMAQEQTLLIQLKQERDKQRKSSGIHGESPLANSENKRAKIREEIVQLQTELKNNKLQKENIYLPEKEKTQQIIKQHDKETQEFKEEEKRLDVLIKTSGKAVSEMEKKETQFQQNYKELFNKRNKISETIQKDESYIAVEDQKIKSVEEKVNTYNIDKAKVVAEKEALEREYDEFKGVKLRQHISMDKLKDDIRKFEQMLQQIGNVNMRALEIYEDIRREYDGLLAKVDNLQKEKDDVLEMMAEIDSKKKQTFLKTFKELAKNFTDIFSQLSTKGEASLVIENKEDPLAGGIDIAVRLIGNKHLDIRSLSGGEKTLAALAFIFAIQEHEPAAFYLLDEVDAALDKKNSDLLSKFVAKYASKAQYILISHNDTVISEADAIYGVSMQENGMSKVVSLKV
jgi:chromosome segregation protein